jgi:voltage-gated potassium channel
MTVKRTKSNKWQADINVGGKLFTYVILMIGLGIVAILTGLIASTLSKQND